MKKVFTLLLFCGLALPSLMAQIPQSSPIPVDVRIESQDGLNRTLTYLGASGWCDTLVQTVSGELVWAYGLDSVGNESDTLVCDSMAADLTGKIALIRRGDCEFGWKALRAQEAGAIGVIIVNRFAEGEDGGGMISMGAGAVGTGVHIPAVFITKETGIQIVEKLDGGVPVTAFFEVRPFGSPRSAYSYHTPLAGVKPLEDVGATFINLDPTTALPSVTLTAEFTAPDGTKTTISHTESDIPPLTVRSVNFDETYTPNKVGTYSVKFTNSLTTDVLEQQFVITDYTFALDNGNIVTNTNGTIEPNDSTFFNTYKFRYDFGNIYRTGTTALTATHASFMISNPQELYTGVPAADLFYINLYNADPDGNGSVPYPAQFTSYGALNETNPNSQLFPLASAEYVLKETDEGFQFLTVEFSDPVVLQPNKLYMLMVEYNGSEAGLGIPPKYAFAGNDRMAGEVGTVIFTDSFRTDGWGSNYNGVVRLHLDGFITGTDTPLDDHKVTVSPNPAANSVNLELDLDAVATVVEVRILDFTGRLVSSRKLNDVKNGRYAFDVRGMANGTYFMSISTPEGVRSRKFQVLH